MNLKPKIVKSHPLTTYEALKLHPGTECFTAYGGYVVGYKFPYGFVSDVLSHSRLADLTSATPCMIVAPPGLGKTTLIFDGFLPLVKAADENSRMLVVGSRTALMDQCRIEAAKHEYPDALTDFTPTGLRKHMTFGKVDIITYQSLFNKLENNTLKDLDDYDVIVMDEAHYFTQDAAFSLITRHLHEMIVKKFAKARRIYLTATPESCMDAIIQTELEHRFLATRAMNQFGVSKVECSFQLFFFEPDYSYINPYFFKEKEKIVELLKEDTSADKFLICVDSKELGARYLEALGDTSAEYINAELKNSSKAEFVDTLVRKESFEKKFLITTSVLDVGVNLKDPALRNVVIHSTDITHFLQAIGRKRKDKDEKINLFIFVPDINSLIKKRGQYVFNFNETNTLIEEIDKKKLSFSGPLPFPFYLVMNASKWEPKYNGYTLIYWNFRINELGKMINAAKDCSNPDEALARVYLGWLSLEDLYSEPRWIGTSAPNELKPLADFLDKYLGKDMCSNDYDIFRRELELIHNEVVPSIKRWRIRKDSITGVSTIRKFFAEFSLPYELTQITAKPLTYRVERR